MTPRDLQLLIYKVILQSHTEFIEFGDQLDLTHIQKISYDFARVTLPYTVCEEAEQYLPVIAESISIFMDMLCAYLDIGDDQFLEEFHIGYKAGEAYLNSLLPEGSDQYESTISIFTMEDDGEYVREEPENDRTRGLVAYDNLEPTEHLYTQNLMSLVNQRMLDYMKANGPDQNDPDVAFELISEVCCEFYVGNLSQKKAAQIAVDFVFEWLFVAESNLTAKEFTKYEKLFKAKLKKAVSDSKKG